MQHWRLIKLTAKQPKHANPTNLCLMLPDCGLINNAIGTKNADKRNPREKFSIPTIINVVEASSRTAT